MACNSKALFCQSADIPCLLWSLGYLIYAFQLLKTLEIYADAMFHNALVLRAHVNYLTFCFWLPLNFQMLLLPIPEWEIFNMKVSYLLSFYSSIGEESICREIFDEYVTQLKEQAKENERKRKEEKVLVYHLHNYIEFYFHTVVFFFFLNKWLVTCFGTS